MVTESQQTPSLPSLLQWGLLLPSALHSASRGRWRSGAWWDVLLLGVCLASSLQLLASWITKNPAWPLQARHILQLPQWIFPRLESIFSSFTSLINGFLSMMILTYETSSECQIQFIQNCSPGPRDNPELSTAQSTTSGKQGSASSLKSSKYSLFLVVIAICLQFSWGGWTYFLNLCILNILLK